GVPIHHAIHNSLQFCCPVLILWSVALVVTTLIPPRPPLRRLYRRSGFVLNATVLLGATLVSLHFCIITAARPSAAAIDSIILFRNAIPRMTGQFVAGALLCLAMSRRCLPLPIWTDRLGFILGLVWLAGLLLVWLSDLLPLLLM